MFWESCLPWQPAMFLSLIFLTYRALHFATNISLKIFSRSLRPPDCHMEETFAYLSLPDLPIPFHAITPKPEIPLSFVFMMQCLLVPSQSAWFFVCLIPPSPPSSAFLTPSKCDFILGLHPWVHAHFLEFFLQLVLRPHIHCSLPSR